jgi:hypothetical protein
MTTSTATKTTTVQGWEWTADIGLFWGKGPNGERETISRPLMTSPWWTVGNTDDLDLDRFQYPEGFVVPIFKTPTDAAQHVAATHRPLMSVEPETNFEVWERNLKTGEETRWGGNHGVGFDLNGAQHKVRQFNEDQPYQDRYENAPTREFFVVETTTTRRYYEG